MDNFFHGLLHPKAYAVHSDGNGVVALYKPCDIMSIPNEDHQIKQKNLLRVPYDSKQRCYFFPRNQKFFLLNRLDAPTSGLLIGCFDQEIANIIRECFFRRVVQKTYCALTSYRKIAQVGEFRDFLEERSERNHLRVHRGTGSEALAKYCIEEEIKMGEIPVLRLRLEPITGRTHQLRIQCALRKMPIVGDRTYGDFSLNKKLWAIFPQKRLYLQSRIIEFSYKFNGKEYLFSSEIPREF
ncbi:MAG: RNA pseudouridine synthase [Puniceicoccales bacterium]|jgi:23S rRNA-/tRNA-specific pseudouridylate synthase|nr:RNA pseudouridine synthase [Puniceicoccales bacterium]